MEDSKELQKVSHLVRSPLNFLGSILGSFTLELLVSVTSRWAGVTVVLVTTVGALVAGVV